MCFIQAAFTLQAQVGAPAAKACCEGKKINKLGHHCFRQTDRQIAVTSCLNDGAPYFKVSDVVRNVDKMPSCHASHGVKFIASFPQLLCCIGFEIAVTYLTESLRLNVIGNM